MCSFDVTRDHREETVAALSRVAADAGAGLQGIVEDIAVRSAARVAAVALVFDHAVLVAAAHGLDGSMHRAGGVPACWSPCARVARHDRPVLIDDMRQEAGGVLRAATAFPHLRSYAGVPLRADGHLAGPCVCSRTGPPRSAPPR
ncbi:GAF domain-containing protein [Actinoplanes xinjiangensis]|uniref:GAF domain-containing protein n=1 Tax=Actinoplanes xinjiangensis TaxID=512350 RepID=UPI00341672BE